MILSIVKTELSGFYLYTKKQLCQLYVMSIWLLSLCHHRIVTS